MVALIVALVIAFLVLVVVARAVRIIPQARAGIVERLGRYSRSIQGCTSSFLSSTGSAGLWSTCASRSSRSSRSR
jgi:regulator of protease activity HflC (stomatin/prohibitin superfamily)